MNAKQSLKIVSKHLIELEIQMRRAEKDIKDYNDCIDHIIAGGSPCDYCEDLAECNLEAKGKGCELWMLRFPEEENHE